MWESQCLKLRERCENSLLLVLKMEEGALSQGVQKWNKARCGSSPRASRRNTALPITPCQLSENHSDPDLRNCKIIEMLQKCGKNQTGEKPSITPSVGELRFIMLTALEELAL